MHDLLINFDAVTPDSWISNENEYREKLSELTVTDLIQIPLINSNASHHLSDGSLVRFRGMVQDMHNPEFFFESFEVYNSVTNEIKTKSGKYRDTADVLANEKINYTENLKSAQRQPLVVVSIPGLSTWALAVEEKQNRLKHLEQQPNSSKRLLETTAKLKRTFNEFEEESAEDMEVSESTETSKEPKKSETVNTTETVVSREHLLNFPLPDVASQSCLVKLYTEEHNLKLNDLIEVIGFLSVDPALSGEFQSEPDGIEMETQAELITHNPPPSLVPRLHAVQVKKLQHCNPLLKEHEFDPEVTLKEAPAAREHLMKALRELLLGDELAAEYLICHLIACVYLRQDTITLGQFCLNLSRVPTERCPQYAQKLYDILKQFVTQSYCLPLTVDSLNTIALLPKKDYDCNRLTSGVLQMGKHTHLVLDETQMQQGRLDSTGVNNVAALGRLIQTQKVEYDFKYYKMEFDSDINVLILSEGKSLLPCDYHLPLEPEEDSLKIFDAIVEAATYYLKEDIMNLIRTYLTSLKLVKFTMGEDLQFVQDDFIALRSAATEAEPVTADDLHRLLVLARLVSLSRGYDALHKPCWDAAVDMERRRVTRVKNRARPNV